jgi:hypothetical protein
MPKERWRVIEEEIYGYYLDKSNWYVDLLSDETGKTITHKDAPVSIVYLPDKDWYTTVSPILPEGISELNSVGYLWNDIWKEILREEKDSVKLWNSFSFDSSPHEVRMLIRESLPRYPKNTVLFKDTDEDNFHIVKDMLYSKMISMKVDILVAYCERSASYTSIDCVEHSVSLAVPSNHTSARLKKKAFWEDGVCCKECLSASGMDKYVKPPWKDDA